MADLRLRISIVEKNERGQEVELVRKTIQFNPQVRLPRSLSGDDGENKHLISLPFGIPVRFYFPTVHIREMLF